MAFCETTYKSDVQNLYHEVYISRKISLRRNCALQSAIKATGLHELPSALLKDCAKNILELLCYIMNSSIKTSTVPNYIWKSAKVVPIFKFGNHDLPENYRPISVLPVLSKVFEKAVHYQLLQFFKTKNFLVIRNLASVNIDLRS